MADEELDPGAEPEAPNVVRLPRDWLGPREALVPIIPLAEPRSPANVVDAESVSQRPRNRHLGAVPSPSLGDAAEMPRIRSVGGVAPPLEEPRVAVSADAFWGEEAQSLHQVVEIPRRARPLADDVEPIAIQTAPPQPVDTEPAQAARARAIMDEPSGAGSVSREPLHVGHRRQRGPVLIGATVLAGLAAAVFVLGLNHPAHVPSSAAAAHGATRVTTHRGATKRSSVTTPRGASTTVLADDVHDGTRPRGTGADVAAGRPAAHRKPSGHVSRPVKKHASGQSAPVTNSESVAAVAAATPSYTTTAPSVQTPPPSPQASVDETDVTESAPPPSVDSAGGATSPTAASPSTAAEHQATNGGGASQLPSGGLPSPQQAALAP